MSGPSLVLRSRDVHEVQEVAEGPVGTCRLLQPLNGSFGEATSSLFVHADGVLGSVPPLALVAHRVPRTCVRLRLGVEGGPERTRPPCFVVGVTVVAVDNDGRPGNAVTTVEVVDDATGRRSVDVGRNGMDRRDIDWNSGLPKVSPLGLSRSRESIPSEEDLHP